MKRFIEKWNRWGNKGASKAAPDTGASTKPEISATAGPNAGTDNNASTNPVKSSDVSWITGGAQSTASSAGTMSTLQEDAQNRKKSARRSKPRYHLRFADNAVALSILLCGDLADKLEKRMPTLEEDIHKSDFFIAPHGLVSLVLFIAFLTIPVAAFGVYMALTTNTLLFAAAAMAPVIVFVFGLYAPRASRSGRANALDSELPFVIGYLSVLMSGGVSPIELFRRLSTSKLFPAAAKEAKRILINVDILALDPLSAIDRAARYTPNKMFSDFLSGYMAVLKIGGDIRSYMDQKQKDVFSHRSIKLKAATEFTGTLAEAYIASTVVMGISLFILQVVQAVLSRTGDFNYNMIYFFSGVFTPMISVAFIYLLHSAQTKEPLVYYKVHILFGAGLAAIPLMLFVVPLDAPDYLKLGIGLALSTAPAAVFNYFYSKKKSAAEYMLPSFVIDLAEIRKTGLAPEKAIEQLSTRNYGKLSEYIRRMSTQVSWGVPLGKVLRDFGKDLRSWFVTSIGFILLEVVEVGGATTGLFTSLADFTQRSRDLEKERKSMFKPYIFMPYIGAILTVISTVLIISMVTNQLASLQSGTGTGIVHVNADTGELTNIMLMATIFQSWTMGLVAGKMGEWSVAAGYKHASALVLIGLITVYIFTNFVKM